MNNFYFMELSKMGFSKFKGICTVKCDIPLFKGQLLSVYKIPGIDSHVGVVYPDGYSVTWPKSWLDSFPQDKVKQFKVTRINRRVTRVALKNPSKSSITRKRLEF